MTYITGICWLNEHKDCAGKLREFEGDCACECHLGVEK